MTQTLLCLGFGYSARALAQRLTPKGWRIIGTSRDPFNFDAVEPLVWPGPQGSEPIALEGVTHILSSIAPTQTGDPVLAAMGDRLATAASLEWVGYLSTTAVYGDHQGRWVDEDTALTPTSARGQWRAEAEAAWQALGLPLHIFRLAGIYGPGRGPFAKLMSGKARRIIKPGQVFSRIHVEDIAQVLEASITQPNPGAVYNVCDTEPAPPQDVLGYAATLLGLPVPAEVPIDEAGMSAMARSFYGENKRVSNARILKELGITLRYPDYRSGLEAVLEAEDMANFTPPATPPGV